MRSEKFGYMSVTMPRRASSNGVCRVVLRLVVKAAPFWHCRRPVVHGTFKLKQGIGTLPRRDCSARTSQPRLRICCYGRFSAQSSVRNRANVRLHFEQKTLLEDNHVRRRSAPREFFQVSPVEYGRSHGALLVARLGCERANQHDWTRKPGFHGFLQQTGEVEIVALRDVYGGLLAGSPRSSRRPEFSDHRRQLERRDVETVVIATFDPGSLIASDAMNAGRDAVPRRGTKGHLRRPGAADRY
jgi:hypothetical protein